MWDDFVFDSALDTPPSYISRDAQAITNTRLDWKETPENHVSTVDVDVVMQVSNEMGKIIMYCPAFFAACTIGGILSRGLTRMGEIPLDLVKNNMQIVVFLFTLKDPESHSHWEGGLRMACRARVHQISEPDLGANTRVMIDITTYSNPTSSQSPVLHILVPSIGVYIRASSRNRMKGPLEP